MRGVLWIVTGVAAALFGGCGGGTEEDCGGCPAGYHCYAGICLPGEDAGDGSGDAADAADAADDASHDTPPADDGTVDVPPDGPPDGCVPTGPETCNGRDDDCDGTVDEGFPCRAGAVVGCTTGCGTTGSGACRADCSLPGPEECAVPAEACNGRDDDCDGLCDDGFSCCAGRVDTCTTLCGSLGTATCDADCNVPRTCEPPAEVCGNLADDDCDGSIDEECVPVNPDSCATPQNVTGGGHFSGTLAGITHDSFPPRACVPNDTDPPNEGVDLHFYFDVTAPSDLLAVVQAGDTWFDSVLYLGTACGGGELACNDDVNPTGGPTGTSFLGSSVSARNLAPGRYYLTVDSFNDSAWDSDWTLDVYLTPTDVPNDRCGGATRIAPGTTTLSGDACTLGHETTGSCGGAGAEAVYYFALGETRTVTISSCAPGTTTDTLLYLRQDCAGLTDLTCNDNAPSGCASVPGASSLSLSLASGVYYLFVDGARPAGCGAYGLALTGI